MASLALTLWSVTNDWKQSWPGVIKSANYISESGHHTKSKSHMEPYIASKRLFGNDIIIYFRSGIPTPTLQKYQLKYMTDILTLYSKYIPKCYITKDMITQSCMIPPTDTWRNDNVFITSKRRQRRRLDVMKTLLLRSVPAGPCLALTESLIHHQRPSQWIWRWRLERNLHSKGKTVRIVLSL